MFMYGDKKTLPFLLSFRGARKSLSVVRTPKGKIATSMGPLGHAGQSSA